MNNKLNELNYNTIIAYNKRNTNDITKIKKLTRDEKTIYKKRIKIENLNSWIKKNKRLYTFNEKTIHNYKSFLYLAFLKIMLKNN